MAAVPYRTGLPSTQKSVKQVCDLIARYSTTILLLADDDDDVKTALAVALAACQVLDVQLERFREYGD